MSWLSDHSDLPGWKRCGHCRYSLKTEKSMIVLSELNPKKFPTTPEIDANLLDLLGKISKVRQLWGKPMIVTSGLRSMEDHKRIYKLKGIPEDKIPMGSKHLYGQAVDISDPKGELAKWCHEHEKELKEIGVWIEATESTPTWVHFQTIKYGSYKDGKSIFFKP
jgi:hypothetical protein